MMAPKFSPHRLLSVAKALPLLALGLFAASQPLKAQAPQPKNDALSNFTENINIIGLETQFDPETGIATAVGDVDIKYGGVQITAGRAEYNSNTKDVLAHENVTIFKDGQIFHGETVSYNFETQELKANNIRSGITPLFYQAANVKSNLGAMKEDSGEIKRIDGDETYFTTHDSDHPNYHMTAKSITIYPGDRVVMHNVKVYAGSLPIFWLPAYVQPLDDEQGFYFRPGYASEWGAFLLNQYGMIYGDHTLAKYRLDLRSKRGVAGGVDLKSLRFKDNDHLGNLILYYAYDTNPGTGFGHENRGEGGPSTDRYRISLQHRIYIPGPSQSSWYLDFDINKLSDDFMLEDYYFSEFRTNPQPDNNIALVKHDDRFTATLWSRFQMNKFYHTDVRMPELAFDFTRQPLWNTGIYYQGETTAGYYREKLTSDEVATLQDKIKTQQTALAGFNGGFVNSQLGTTTTGTTYDAHGNPISQATGIQQLAGTTLTSNSSDFYRATPRILTTQDEVQKDIAALQEELGENKFARVHSYHEFLYPISVGDNGWLNFVPRIGGGFTNYSSVSGGAKDFHGGTQGIFALGFDVAAKFSRTWDNVQSRTWGLDGLRHVIQPYVNYSFLQADPLDGLPGIDRLTPSTRPRPIDVPLFTAIDDLHSWNIARVGVRNTLQTKRDGVAYNWLGLNTYADIFFKDPEFDRDVSNLYNDLYWRPLPWLQLNVDSQLPIGSSSFNFTEVNTSFTIMPTKNFSWTIGHGFIRDNPIFVNSSLIFSRIYARLSENWGVSMNHIYEATDHTLEYQSYSIHRDLSSWVVSLGGLVRDSRGANDYGVVLTFTLKDFPQVSVPIDLDPNPAGRGP